MIGVVIAIGTAIVGGGVAAWEFFLKPKEMTPQQKEIYLAALHNLQDADKLRKLADTFEKEGFKKEANELRKRAAMLEKPPTVKEEYKQILATGLLIDDPRKAAAVKNLANTFRDQGAPNSANQLDAKAKALAAAQAAPYAPAPGDGSVIHQAKKAYEAPPAGAVRSGITEAVRQSPNAPAPTYHVGGSRAEPSDVSGDPNPSPHDPFHGTDEMG